MTAKSWLPKQGLTIPRSEAANLVDNVKEALDGFPVIGALDGWKAWLRCAGSRNRGTMYKTGCERLEQRLSSNRDTCLQIKIPQTLAVELDGIQ